MGFPWLSWAILVLGMQWLSISAALGPLQWGGQAEGRLHAASTPPTACAAPPWLMGPQTLESDTMTFPLLLLSLSVISQHSQALCPLWCFGGHPLQSLHPAGGRKTGGAVECR